MHDVRSVWKRFERLIFSARGNRKRVAMLMMEKLSQKDFQFIYYFFFVLFNFFLFVCLIFFNRDKQNIFLKSMASLIPADTRLSSLKRKKNVFWTKWNSYQYRKNQGRLSVSVLKVWRNLCQKVVLPSSIRPRSFLPEINSSNKEIRKAVSFFRIVNL